MRKPFTLILFFPLLFSSCHAQPQSGHFEPVAVVELFTSEGCSSCPPADKLLSKLIATAERDHQKIFALSFHVDYWDRLGWRDPFSSSRYSDRQRAYAEALNLNGVYTPQMVVNGSAELVGSDEGKLNKAVAKSLQMSGIATFSKLAKLSDDNQKLHLRYELSGSYRDCDIHFALVSRHEATAVKRGENSGRQLSHTNVVRQFISLRAEAEGEATIDISAYRDKNNLLVIAFLQRNDDLHILTSAALVP